MSSSKSKERILAKIREANSVPRERLIPTPDFEQDVHPASEDDPAIIFASNFTAAAGKWFIVVLIKNFAKNSLRI